MEKELALVRCRFIPQDLEQGNFYYSEEFSSSTHLCACGCGQKVSFPIKKGEWRLREYKGKFWVWPSVGSRSLPCRSHYVISGNRLKWCPPMSDHEADFSFRRDRAHRARLYEPEVKSAPAVRVTTKEPIGSVVTQPKQRTGVLAWLRNVFS